MPSSEFSPVTARDMLVALQTSSSPEPSAIYSQPGSGLLSGEMLEVMGADHPQESVIMRSLRLSSYIDLDSVSSVRYFLSTQLRCWSHIVLAHLCWDRSS